ncbi:MAG: S8 family serine peptidase [Crocinitomicaceae bacterium]
MKNLLSLFLILGSFCYATISFSQESSTLLLKSGKYKLEQNINDFISKPTFNEEELVDDHYYRIICFSQTPTQQDKKELSENGIQLLDYLPKKSFYAAIKTTANLSILSTKNALSVVPIETNYKLIPDLINEKYADWALLSNNEIALRFNFFEGVNELFVKEQLAAIGGKIISDIFPQTLTVSINIDQLQELYALPFCYYFEFIDAPEVAEGYKDVTNHRAAWMQNPNGGGVAYTGAGVNVMMQDDGTIGPHIDYEGRLTTEVSSNSGDHGDHVAGIIMGAGNLDEEAIGNAPGAHLYVYSSANSNYGFVPELVDTGNLVITSKSYGDGQNAGYTTLSRSLDEQCRNYDQLIHVFSAGNSGTSNFGYGAGAGWGNITGGHKQGKNVLAVGNLSFTDVLSASSSRGPASDGRIKPDICAVGTNVISTIDDHTYDTKTGTSMAAPAVAGCLALLYEAYKDLHGGQNPSAALINAIVLNTADDLGNPGPDFKYGWGRINVKKAYELMAGEQYISSQIQQGATNQHQVNIPAGTKQVKIMVYWTDYQASPSASKALVNDLNLTATDPSGTTFLPYILNPLPNPGLLDQDAEPGVDDLNNMEQIVISNPLAGQYNLNIQGFDVPEGIQEYYISYEIIQDDLTITYPIGGESVKPGPEWIRWDAIGEDENFKLEYSVDAGSTWETIASSLPGSFRSFQWNAPSSEVSAHALVRITRGSESVTSNEFNLIRRPGNLNVEWACPNSFNFSWNPVQGAVAYEVFLLGDKYMEYAGYTETTDATVYANSLETQWVSVRAIGADGAISKRAIALEKSPGIFDCTLQDPVANFSATCTETGPGSCVTFEDASTNAGQGAAWVWYCPGGTPTYSNLEKPTICYENEGNYDVQLIVKNGVGEDTLYMSNFVSISPRQSLPFKEDFESSLLPDGFTYFNEGNGAYGLNSNVSAYGYGNNSFYFDNYYSAAGSSSSFITDQYDFSKEDVVYELQFDVAYAKKATAADSLKIYVTNDCDNSRQLIYTSGGAALATASDNNDYFTPTDEEWRNAHVSLSAFTDWSSLSFIFESESDNGNTIYVDNINVLVSKENFSDYLISVFPNPFTNEVSITGLVEGESTTIRVTSVNGQLVHESTFTATGGTQILQAENWADGVYILNIQSDSKTHKTKLVKGDE